MNGKMNLGIKRKRKSYQLVEGGVVIIAHHLGLLLGALLRVRP